MKIDIIKKIMIKVKKTRWDSPVVANSINFVVINFIIRYDVLQ